MSLENRGAWAVLLSEQTPWSDNYSHQMTALGVSTLVRPAEQASVDVRMKDHYVVPVYGPTDPKFELVEYITSSGLRVVVLAARDFSNTDLQARKRNAVCFRKTLDSREVVNWIKPFLYR